jgi:hypothetical protein
LPPIHTKTGAQLHASKAPAVVLAFCTHNSFRRLAPVSSILGIKSFDYSSLEILKP